MRLADVIAQPRVAIPELVEQGGTAVPVLTYLLLSFSQADTRTLRHVNAAPLLQPAVAGVVGAAGILLFYGGGIHAAARVLGGRRGWRASIRGVGYALFWPTILGATAFAIRLLAQALGALELDALPNTMKSFAGFWAIYLVIIFAREWHHLSWPRAIATPFCVVALLICVVALAAALARPGRLVRGVAIQLLASGGDTRSVKRGAPGIMPPHVPPAHPRHQRRRHLQ